MPDYDGAKLANVASRLERATALLPWGYALAGAVAGGGLGQVAPLFLPMIMLPPTVMSLLLGAVVAVGAGYLGHVRALSLRLAADAARCQAKLEEGLRAR